MPTLASFPGLPHLPVSSFWSLAVFEYCKQSKNCRRGRPGNEASWHTRAVDLHRTFRLLIITHFTYTLVHTFFVTMSMSRKSKGSPAQQGDSSNLSLQAWPPSIFPLDVTYHYRRPTCMRKAHYAHVYGHLDSNGMALTLNHLTASRPFQFSKYEGVNRV